MRLIDADALDEAFTDLRFSADGTLAHWGDRPDWCLHGSEVEKLIENAPTIGGWISVKDRLPENQNPVMVFVPPHVDEIKGTFLGYVGMAYYTSLGEGFWCGTDGNLYGAIGMIHTPTHWMPMPEPPKETNT